MENNKVKKDFFDELEEIHKEKNDILGKYPKLRYLLERVCKDLTVNESIQFSNLFSRLSYVCKKRDLNKSGIYHIHKFRINANSVLHSDYKPTQEDYLQDLKAICDALSHFYSTKIPLSLSEVLPGKYIYNPKQSQGKDKIEVKDKIRVVVSSKDEQYIYAYEEENPTEEPIKIRYNVTKNDRLYDTENDRFNDTVAALWEGCQLNLIDVKVIEQGFYLPALIILEPDYLLDISSLSECMKEYGKHPLNYIQSKFEPIKNTKHILLGNVANLFFDELVNDDPNYDDSLKKAFKNASLEFSTCQDINQDFLKNTKQQFQNIKNVVKRDFKKYGIEKENAILEPSFICQYLGVQGRLDFLQHKSEKKFVIELKSGKAPFPENNFELTGLITEVKHLFIKLLFKKYWEFDLTT
jgi:hypothetical protein